MANFYLEEPVSRDSGHRLVELRHVVVDAKDLLPRSTSDHVHFATAARMGYILVTTNKDDFLLLHRAWRDWFVEWSLPPFPQHAGLLLVPQPPQLDAISTAEILHAFVTTSVPPNELVNRCFLYERARGWRED